MVVVLARAATYSALFIGLLLVYLPNQILSSAGIGQPAIIGAWQVVGMLIGVCGAALALACILTFVTVGRGTPAPFDPPRRLVVKGPYRFIRNPMYVGAGLALTGAALFYLSTPLLGYAGVFLVLMHVFVVFYEEPTLRGAFDGDYETYCRQVGRWWPKRLPIEWLAMAGILGPIWFILLVIVQGILQPDYSHIAMPISALAAWPAGWMQNLNFFVSAILTAAFAIGMHSAIRPRRFGLAGIFLLLASSLGLLVVGLYPWINVNGVPTEPPRHVVGAVLTFVGASLGLVILSRRMAADPQWRNLSGYVLATGIAMLLLFILVGGFAIEEGTPFHPWVGLLQRILVTVWFACMFVIASRALRLPE